MQEQTTIPQVLAHVQAQQDKLQDDLHALYAKDRTLDWSTHEYRANQIQLHETVGQVLALARICGYLQARVQIDQINAAHSLEVA